MEKITHQVQYKSGLLLSIEDELVKLTEVMLMNTIFCGNPGFRAIHCIVMSLPFGLLILHMVISR